MKPKWQILNPDPGKIDILSKTLGISKTVATVLVNRGIDEVETASMFLQAKIKSLPDPFLLKDCLVYDLLRSVPALFEHLHHLVCKTVIVGL